MACGACSRFRNHDIRKADRLSERLFFQLISPATTALSTSIRHLATIFPRCSVPLVVLNVTEHYGR